MDPTSPALARHDPYVSLRNRNFLWYAASMVAMTLGTMIQGTVVAWQVYALTKDPLSLGLVGLAEAIPFIGAALYAGHVGVGLPVPGTEIKLAPVSHKLEIRVKGPNVTPGYWNAPS